MEDGQTTWFGVAFRLLRRWAGLSQQQVAVAADLNHTYVHMIERGKKHNLTIDAAKSLVAALPHGEVAAGFLKYLCFLGYVESREDRSFLAKLSSLAVIYSTGRLDERQQMEADLDNQSRVERIRIYHSKGEAQEFLPTLLRIVIVYTSGDTKAKKKALAQVDMAVINQRIVNSFLEEFTEY